MHSLVLHNETVKPASSPFLASGQVGFLNGWGVFSTIRVRDGVLFAYERHWRRMVRDAALLRVPMPSSPDWLHSQLSKLVDANQALNATLRLAIVRNKGGMFEGPGLVDAKDHRYKGQKNSGPPEKMSIHSRYDILSGTVGCTKDFFFGSENIFNFNGSSNGGSLPRSTQNEYWASQIEVDGSDHGGIPRDIGERQGARDRAL